MRLSGRIALGLMLAIGCSVAWTAPTEKELERFMYAWTQAAQVIVEGSIIAISRVDDPDSTRAYIEVSVRVESIQRGSPKNGTLVVRIEDELQASLFESTEADVGDRGMWFVNRVGEGNGELTVGYLIRYMSAKELASDAITTDNLIRYVIEDTIDQAVESDILKALEPGRAGSRQTVALRLSYDDAGQLTGIEVVRNSGNMLFDEHVFDKAAELHRTIRPPGKVGDVDVVVTRSQAALDRRRARAGG